MADKTTELLEMMMGALMVQTTICRFLIKEGIIDRASLVAHLAERRVSWEKTAPAGALFPVDFVMNVVSQQQEPSAIPSPPASLH
jgi:hypothetical protein